MEWSMGGLTIRSLDADRPFDISYFDELRGMLIEGMEKGSDIMSAAGFDDPEADMIDNLQVVIGGFYIPSLNQWVVYTSSREDLFHPRFAVLAMEGEGDDDLSG